MINKYDQASAMIYQAERTLREATLDHGMDFVTTYRVQITPLIQQLHQALSEDSEALVANTEALRRMVHELQRVVFERTQAEYENLGTWHIEEYLDSED